MPPPLLKPKPPTKPRRPPSLAKADPNRPSKEPSPWPERPRCASVAGGIRIASHRAACDAVVDADRGKADRMRIGRLAEASLIVKRGRIVRGVVKEAVKAAAIAIA